MFLDGIFGTRANIFIDCSLIYFVLVPFIMFYSIRKSNQGRHHLHKKLQLMLLILMITFILVLELNIQLGETKKALAQSSFANTEFLKYFFIFHLIIALATFISWVFLSAISWSKFLNFLPGGFSVKHKIWGFSTYVGLCVTSLTGLVLYILGFAL
ncbi:MAG: DUF420 domain-containing protein [Pseudomonadota bacterium]